MALLGLICSALAGRIVESLIGLAIGIGIMMIAFLSGGMAGGDVKLSGALGAWLGLDVLQMIFIACAIGFVWVVIRLQKSGVLKNRATLFIKGAYYRIVYGINGVMSMSTLPEEDDMPLPPEVIPFGVCLAVGFWVIVIARVMLCH
jgi:Flp pilus assembly protein protease CpaA